MAKAAIGTPGFQRTLFGRDFEIDGWRPWAGPLHSIFRPAAAASVSESDTGPRDSWNPGRASQDTVARGGPGRYRVEGSDEDGTATVGEGRDILWASEDSDIFAYHSLSDGGDFIFDFGADDVIDLRDIMALDEVSGHELVQSGGDVWVMLEHDGAVERFLTLKQVSLDSLTDDNFLLTDPGEEWTPAGDGVILATADGERIELSQFGPEDEIGEISANGFENVSIVGTAGDDYLDFSRTLLTDITHIEDGDGNDTIIGSPGDDTFKVQRGRDSIDGWNGSDTYLVDRNSGLNELRDTGTGADDYDRIVATQDGTRIFLSGFDDSNGIEEISANGHLSVTIDGLGADETFDFTNVTLDGIAWISSGGGNDTVRGSQGDDAIIGGSGDDTLIGNDGNDILVGNGGADTLTGGAGSDVFEYRSLTEGGDLVTDFSVSEDMLDLSALAGSIDGVQFVQDGTDTLVMVDASGTLSHFITLQDVDASEMTDANWTLV